MRRAGFAAFSKESRAVTANSRRASLTLLKIDCSFHCVAVGQDRPAHASPAHRRRKACGRL